MLYRHENGPCIYERARAPEDKNLLNFKFVSSAHAMQPRKTMHSNLERMYCYVIHAIDTRVQAIRSNLHTPLVRSLKFENTSSRLVTRECSHLAHDYNARAGPIYVQLSIVLIQQDNVQMRKWAQDAHSQLQTFNNLLKLLLKGDLFYQFCIIHAFTWPVKHNHYSFLPAHSTNESWADPLADSQY